MKTYYDYYKQGFKAGLKAVKYSVTTMGEGYRIANNIDRALAKQEENASKKGEIIYRENDSETNPIGVVDCVNAMEVMINEPTTEYKHVLKDMEQAIYTLMDSIVVASESSDEEVDYDDATTLNFKNNPKMYDYLEKSISSARKNWIMAYTNFKPASVVEM